MEKKYYCKNNKELEQATQRGFGISVLGGFKDLPGLTLL